MAKSYGCKDFCWIIGAPAQKKGSEGRWRECSGTLDGDHYRCLYESSPDVSAFFSEFDAYLGGNATFTAAEQNGYRLFNRRAHCSQRPCNISQLRDESREVSSLFVNSFGMSSARILNRKACLNGSESADDRRSVSLKSHISRNAVAAWRNADT
jgi:hypothetical protein